MAAPSRLAFVLLIYLGAYSALSGQTGTALVRHAPTLNGNVDGSIQQMLPENTTFNSGASVTGRLLVPGTPAVQLNGSPLYGGTLEGTGAATPTSHKVTLNSGAALAHVVRRTDAVALTAVAAPPPPAGTRSVSLNHSSQSPGDFATLRNLTLNSNVGQVTVPPGTYGNFNANSGSGFTLGVAGATTPAIYHFQKLTLNSNSGFQVVGPVVVTLNGGFSTNTNMGSSAHPEWLQLRIAGGGLSLATNRTVYAHLLAPAGTLTLNGGAQFVGQVSSDRLIVNSNALLRLVVPATTNQPPTVAMTAPVDGGSYQAPATVILAATAVDADGAVTKVEFFSGTTSLGEDFNSPYTLTLNGVSAGSHTYYARATDSNGATTDSATVTIAVQSPNQPPTVAIAAPADGALYTAPASLTLAATAADVDGSVAKVEFHAGGTKLGEDFSAPFEWVTSPLTPGAYVITVTAWDNLHATTTSNPINVTVVAPNQPPTVTLTAPPDGSGFPAPASFSLVASAADPDGSVTKLEFYQGTTLLGEDLVAPFELPVAGLAAGTYNFLARATDSAGSATDSAPVTVTVEAANQPPVVVLTSPLSGASYAAPANILLEADASDADGTVARVEFYQGATKLGEDMVSPYSFAWENVTAGNYALSARAFDDDGAEAGSAASTVSVLAQAFTLPFLAGFEASEGYTLGPIQGHHGWVASSSSVVTDADFASGTHSVVVPGQFPALELSHAFFTPPTPSVVFVDLFTLPHAAESEAESSLYETLNAARIAFVREGEYGRFRVYRGNGAGGGTWESSQSIQPVDGDGYSHGWLRLTVRLDFPAKRWDLYVNGFLAAADIPFTGTAQNELGAFSLMGSHTAPTLLDDFLATAENPLFADADSDGLDDGWETMFGLNPAVNDRAADPDGDGISNLLEYTGGSDPADYFNGSVPAITVLEGANGQPGADGLVEMLIADSSGQSLVNAPVRFAIVEGTGAFALDAGAGSPVSVDRSLRTDAAGRARVYYRQPAGQPVEGIVWVKAGPTTRNLWFDDAPPTNVPPSVSLTAPLAGSSIMGARGVVLAARAFDSDGSIAKVEFFADGAKLGESTTAPYYWVWSDPSIGSHVLTVKATDEDGGEGTGTEVTIAVPALGSPLAVHDFETSEGYVVGSLADQGPWQAVGANQIQVTTSVAYSGQQSLVINPPPIGSGYSYAILPLPDPEAGQTERFIDLWWKPVAGDSVNQATYLGLNGPGIGFVRNGSIAELQGYFYNEGSEEYWYSGKQVAVDAQGVVQEWQRITLRQDVNTGQIDVYLNGELALANLWSWGGQPRLTLFGNSLAASRFDHLRLLADNPYIADADHDGMDDAWEAAHGLNPGYDDRQEDNDHDGIRNIDEYFHNTPPVDLNDSDGDTLPDSWELGNFGSLQASPWDDPDADNWNNFAEFTAGTHPNDYFNNLPPRLNIVSGNNQTGVRGRTNDLPLTVSVHAGLDPRVNVPVVFEVTEGGGLLSSDFGSGNVVTAYTDGAGIARVYYQQPPEIGVQSTIRATAGTVTEVSFSSVSILGTQPYTGQPVIITNGLGNHQGGLFGQFNIRPYSFTILTADTQLPVGNAPVVLTVTSGGGSVAATNDGTGVVSTAVTIFTNEFGQASGYYQHPALDAGVGQVRVSVGGASSDFISRGYYRSIATGQNHGLALTADHTAWAWGANAQGQLGNGGTAASLAPVAVTEISDVIALAAYGDRSLALVDDGTVWIWGAGVLDGPASVPTAIASLTNAGAIAAGGTQNLALRKDGTVWTVGYDTTAEALGVPIQVSGLDGIHTIAAGGAHQLALREDGAVLAWGSNSSGQLGDGSGADQPAPVRVVIPGPIMAIAAGEAHSLALRADGTVWAWGANAQGQLGDGTTTSRFWPILVPGLTNIVAIAANGAFSFALRTDGVVMAWGADNHGQVSDGATAFRNTPVVVAGLHGVVALAGGGNHALALKSNGTVWSWGDNTYWQAGDVSPPKQIALNLAPPPVLEPENGVPPPEANPGPSPDPTGAVRLNISLPPRHATY